jgi:hypothetical protein
MTVGREQRTNTEKKGIGGWKWGLGLTQHNE